MPRNLSSIVEMNSHSRGHLEQKGLQSVSQNTHVHAMLGGHGHLSATDAHLYSTRDVTPLPGCSGKASLTHSHLAAHQQLRQAESDRWSVDSPKESGYYSEESSVGHSGEMPTSSSSSHQGLHGCESCRFIDSHLCEFCNLLFSFAIITCIILKDDQLVKP